MTGAAMETFVPLEFKRKKGQWLADAGAPAHDVWIVKAIARAMHWQRQLDSGAFKSVNDLAGAEGIDPTIVGKTLRLARLAPDIVEAALTGRQPRCLTLAWLMHNNIPATWSQQRRVLSKFN